MFVRRLAFVLRILVCLVPVLALVPVFFVEGTAEAYTDCDYPFPLDSWGVYYNDGTTWSTMRSASDSHCDVNDHGNDCGSTLTDVWVTTGWINETYGFAIYRGSLYFDLSTMVEGDIKSVTISGEGGEGDEGVLVYLVEGPNTTGRSAYGQIGSGSTSFGTGTTGAGGETWSITLNAAGIAYVESNIGESSVSFGLREESDFENVEPPTDHMYTYREATWEWDTIGITISLDTISSGSGTPEDPYEISDACGLQSMSDNLSAYYELVGNIDASGTNLWNDGAGFSPVGTAAEHTPFSGGFDGNGYSISDLVVSRPDTSNVGLFGVTNGAVIKDFTLVNSDFYGFECVGSVVGLDTGLGSSFSGIDVVEGYVEAYAPNSGGFAGSLDGLSTTVEGCSTDESTSVYSNSTDYVGGFVGKLVNGSIEFCSSDTYVSGYAAAYVGGFVGGIYGGSASISRCWSTGDVYGYNYVGGFIGESYDGGPIEDCYSMGNVLFVSGYDGAGGFAGVCTSDSISRCFSKGSVAVDNITYDSRTTTPDSDSEPIYGTHRHFASISLGGVWAIDEVKVLVYRVGSPGTVTVGYYDQVPDEECEQYQPDTSALGTGTFDGDLITTDTDGEWVTVIISPMSASTESDADVVLSAAGGDESNYIVWKMLNTGEEMFSGRIESGDCWSWGGYRMNYSIGRSGYESVFGGFIGDNDGGTITDCYWDTETSGLAVSDGGTGKTTVQMKIRLTFSGWDFTTVPVWYIGSGVNGGYPNLVSGDPIPTPTSHAALKGMAQAVSYTAVSVFIVMLLAFIPLTGFSIESIILSAMGIIVLVSMLPIVQSVINAI